MSPRPILLCTLGTSLFRPNLEGLKKELAADNIRPDLRPLAEAYQARDWPAVAQELAKLLPTDRVCGAEINSIASMIANGYVPRDCGLFFLHSDTQDGRSIGAVLEAYYRAAGHEPVKAVDVPDLQDQDAKRFRTKGLRNLARRLCGILRERSAPACAINATGGYKAQIAIAVLLGQALGVPVYYKHELFSEIIAFPPMPVALDFEVWMRASGLLTGLERSKEPVPATRYFDEWDEKYESLVERVQIDGQDYLELAPTGQIFHETFRDRFHTERDRVLPPGRGPGRRPKPVLHDHAVVNLLREELSRYLQAVIDQVPQVVGCVTNYCNPDLPETTRFRERGGALEGVYSDGTRTVKFMVESTAITAGQRAAVVAALNDWLDKRR
jgi:putative CRISPR-associated protein (TIGR02619 family)